MLLVPTHYGRGTRLTESCYNSRVFNPFAKIAPQQPQNQQDDLVSGKQFVLRWAYQTVHETLWRMEYGAGLMQKVAWLLDGSPPQLEAANWEAHLRADLIELEKTIPRNLAQEDWVARRKAEISRETRSLPEVGMLARLIRANATRTVRKLANESRFCQRGPLGYFLSEYPGDCLPVRKSQLAPA